jgi:predicted nucleotidyltransferase
MSDEITRIGSQVHAWCEDKPVRLCVLFGSQATQETHLHSDVDLAVWPVASLAPLEKLQWIVELEMLLDQSVSLVLVSPELDPVLGFEIVKNGRVIFEQESEFWFRERSRLIWGHHARSAPANE